MSNCTDCQKTYQAYLSNLPSEWRTQIADLMCKIVDDVNTELVCSDVRACETLTSLSAFTLAEGVLSVTYKDERGTSVTRTIDIGTASGEDFIQNQDALEQPATFWISGTGSAGALDVTDSVIPDNGIYLPAANNLGFATNGTIVGQFTTLGKFIVGATGDNGQGGSIQAGTIISANDNASSLGLPTNRWNTLYSDRIQMASVWTVDNASTERLRIDNGGRVYVNGALSVETSAQFIVNSTTAGFLPPRMDTAQRTAIGTPAAGLIVFDTDLMKLCLYTTGWEVITSV